MIASKFFIILDQFQTVAYAGIYADAAICFTWDHESPQGTAEGSGMPRTLTQKMIRTRLAAATAGIACSLCFLLGGCSSPKSNAPTELPFTANSDTATSGPDEFTPSVEGTAPSSIDSAQLGSSGDVTMKAEDGTTVTAAFQFSSILTASSANTVWQSLTSDAMACSNIDPTRDAIVVGTVAFQNETPSFTPQVRFMFLDPLTYSDYQIDVGVDYKNQPACINLDAGITPDFSGTASWGPAPIEIVLHQFYSPASPSGAKTADVQFNAVVSADEWATATLSSDSAWIVIAPGQLEHVGIFKFT
jgi:hypothetical protein